MGELHEGGRKGGRYTVQQFSSWKTLLNVPVTIPSLHRFITGATPQFIKETEPQRRQRCRLLTRTGKRAEKANGGGTAATAAGEEPLMALKKTKPACRAQRSSEVTGAPGKECHGLSEGKKDGERQAG